MFLEYAFYVTGQNFSYFGDFYVVFDWAIIQSIVLWNWVTLVRCAMRFFVLLNLII